MKVVLGIFCVLALLFTGGCAVIFVQPGLSASTLFAIVLAAIAVLNLVVLFGLFDRQAMVGWAFYTLAAVDFALALALGLSWRPNLWGLFGNSDLGVPVMGFLLLKGGLTLVIALRHRQEPDA